jgi:sporulation protein YlmC with PRC-barrel domain
MSNYISVKGLKGFSIVATDGPIGSVDQVFFDDDRRAVRYVVVQTGRDFNARRVLVSTLSVTEIDRPERTVRVNLGRQHVLASPDIDTHKPVSRQKELEYNRYYRLPIYWGGGEMWGAAMTPSLLLAASPPAEDEGDAAQGADVHLRSSTEVLRYRVVGTDGESGRLDDLLFDDQAWAIRTLVVRRRKGWHQERSSIGADKIATIAWETKMISLSAPLLDSGGAA